MSLGRSIITLLLFISLKLIGQIGDQPISEPINQGLLEHFIKEGIDSVRRSYELKDLANDSILYVAAKHHAKYLKKKNKLSHFEKGNLGYENPQERANTYGIGKNYYVGENVALNYYLRQVGKKKGKLQIHKTYKTLAHAIVISWVNSPGHFKNIITPEYNTTGLAVAVNQLDRSVFAVQKFGQALFQYQIHENKNFFSYSNFTPPKPIEDFDSNLMHLHKGKHAWKTKSPSNVEQYQKANQIIDADPRILKIIPQGRSIKVRTQGVPHLAKFIRNRKDGLAIEIVKYEEYHCGNPQYYLAQSRRNRQCEYSGRLLKPHYFKKLNPRIQYSFGAKYRKSNKDFPFYKAFFEAFNPLPKKKFNYRLGRIPKNIDGFFEFNLVYLKNKEVVRVRHLSSVCGDPITPYSIPQIIYNAPFDTVSFNIPTFDSTYFFYFPKSVSEYKMQDITPLLYDGFERYLISDAKIQAYSSIEGLPSINDKLQKDRAESIAKALQSRQDLPIQPEIESNTNWKLFENQLPLTKYSYLSEFSQEEQKRIVDSLLKMDTLLPDLELMLDSQRYASIYLSANYNYKDYALELFQEFHQHFLIELQSKEIQTSLNLVLDLKFHQLINSVQQAIKNGLISKEKIHLFKPPRLAGMPRSWNTYYTRLNELELLEEDDNRWTNLYQLVNIVGNPIPPELIHNAIAEQIRNYRNQQTKLEAVAVELNEHIQKLHLKPEFKNVADSFQLALSIDILNKIESMGESSSFSIASDYVFNYYSTNKVEAKELLEVAELYVFIEDYNKAYLLLEPYVDLDNPHLGIISLYSKLIYQNSIEYPEALYGEWLKAIHPLFPEKQWCELFVGPCNISFQVFDDKSVRDLYCKSCADYGNYATDPPEEAKEIYKR